MPTVIVVAVLVVIVALAVRSLIKQKKSGGGLQRRLRPLQRLSLSKGSGSAGRRSRSLLQWPRLLHPRQSARRLGWHVGARRFRIGRGNMVLWSSGKKALGISSFACRE